MTQTGGMGQMRTGQTIGDIVFRQEFVQIGILWWWWLGTQF